MKTIEEVFIFNLRRLRGSRTQAEIAESAGIPLRSYQRAEYGDIPQGPNRQAIARAFGLDSETALFIDPELTGIVTAAEAWKIVGIELENRQSRPAPLLRAAEPAPSIPGLTAEEVEALNDPAVLKRVKTAISLPRNPSRKRDPGEGSEST